MADKGAQDFDAHNLKRQPPGKQVRTTVRLASIVNGAQVYGLPLERHGGHAA